MKHFGLIAVAVTAIFATQASAQVPNAAASIVIQPYTPPAPLPMPVTTPSPFPTTVVVQPSPYTPYTPPPMPFSANDY